MNICKKEKTHLIFLEFRSSKLFISFFLFKTFVTLYLLHLQNNTERTLISLFQSKIEQFSYSTSRNVSLEGIYLKTVCHLPSYKLGWHGSLSSIDETLFAQFIRADSKVLLDVTTGFPERQMVRVKNWEMSICLFPIQNVLSTRFPSYTHPSNKIKRITMTLCLSVFLFVALFF